MNQSWSPLTGAIDLHIHIAPDTIERYYDSVSLAREAREKGMRAIVLKDQMCPSVHKAILTSYIVPEIKIFGGVALNHTNGGLNPRSVAVTLKSGGKIIWLPTVDAEYCQRKASEGHWISNIVQRNTFGHPQEGISLIGSGGKCVPIVGNILKMAADSGAIVATGHISAQECLAVVDLNANIGANILITHPNIWFEDFPLEVLKALVQGGAIIEFVMGGLTPLRGRGDPMQIVRAIRHVGHQNCCLATDFGGIENSSPPEGLRTFCYILNRCGLSQEEVDFMTKQKPAELLGLDR
jgi:hypothetical protein